MLFQGLTLTIVGMSVVFIFLTLLVLAMKLFSAIILKYFPDQPSVAGIPVKTNIKKETVSSVSDSDNREIAAVIAAVAAFKKN